MGALEKLGYVLIATSLVANAAFAYLIVSYLRWVALAAKAPAAALHTVLAILIERFAKMPDEYVIQRHADGRVVIWHEKRVWGDSRVIEEDE